MSWSIYIHLLL